MQCPECHAKNPTDATSCAGCGLILFKLAATAPKGRRREDLAQVKRRSADSTVSRCPMCTGEVSADAVRCIHCTAILKEDFHEKLMQRRRSQINYASWVAYIFGLLVFLIFRPVGLFSIAAGLMLSIVYYAIPVASPTPKRNWKEFLKKQFSTERVAVALPHLRTKKFIFIGTPLIAAVAGFVANFVVLQRPMNQILEQNSAFNGMTVSTHYEYWVVPGVVVYDLRAPDKAHDPIVVQTALLEFASRLRNTKLKSVELQFRGTKRLSLDGESFRRLGDEYAKKNYRFGLFELPKLVRTADNRRLNGGADESSALLELHRIWYTSDAGRPAAQPAKRDAV